jgi:hypothetical protein
MMSDPDVLPLTKRVKEMSDRMLPSSGLETQGR